MPPRVRFYSDGHLTGRNSLRKIKTRQCYVLIAEERIVVRCKATGETLNHRPLRPYISLLA